MSLVLYSHPLANFCQKVLIALYENATPFELHHVDLGDPKARAEFEQLTPLAKMPVLRDRERDRVVTETSIIIEYLALHYPGPQTLLPSAAADALPVRSWDRFYDLYVSEPMSKIVTDHIRPDGERDPFGVTEAKAALGKAYGVIERQLSTRAWAVGDAFTMADCAAGPALFYADKVMSLAGHPHAAAYLERLRARPSFARALQEAEPYFKQFPVPSDLNR
ncbi:MAG TPA: glutathione S-transferase family protein [Polyangiales bacterium]|nr:glutathione S-transferase family protein [Polyangiales bacterium]